MPEFVLHHYETSPFSEKVRRLLAWKGLSFRSVRAPAVMPKPDLVALTGGYRKIPVLQVGADVYCDTALIAGVIERAAPTPTAYPSPLATIVAEWADGPLFESAVSVAMRPTRFDDFMRLLTPEELSGIVADRAAMASDARRPGLPRRAGLLHLSVYLQRLEDALARTDYLLGDAPCIADFSAYHPAWFLEKMTPEPLAPFAAIRRWMDRISAFPSTEGAAVSSGEALEIARTSVPIETAGLAGEAAGLSLGVEVGIRALDYGRDPVAGTLVALTPEEIVVRRTDPRAGTVHVHFPRVGYEITTEKR